MQVVQKRSSIGHLSVFTALWFINVLIVIFGSPFLIYKKIKEICLRTTKNSKPEVKTQPEPARYFPCRIDSKL